MSRKTSELKRLAILTIGATLALWSGGPNGNIDRGNKSYKQEILENLVPKEQIERVMQAPTYAQDYNIVKDSYRKD